MIPCLVQEKREGCGQAGHVSHLVSSLPPGLWFICPQHCDQQLGLEISVLGSGARVPPCDPSMGPEGKKGVAWGPLLQTPALVALREALVAVSVGGMGWVRAPSPLPGPLRPIHPSPKEEAGL